MRGTANDRDTDGSGTHPRLVRTHIGDITPLLERGEHTPASTDLVIAPVALHRRAIKRRLVDAERPRDSLALVRPEAVAIDVLETARGRRPEIVNRVDRLELLTSVLESRPTIAERFRRILGSVPAESVREVEHARNEIETITGYNPERVRAIEAYCRRTDAPAATDARELLAATIDIEAALRRRSTGATSTGALLRTAARTLCENGTSTWEATYPSIERVWVCGLSTISASLLDLLVAIHRTADVETSILLRRASGSVLDDRLRELFAIEEPGREVFGRR